MYIDFSALGKKMPSESVRLAECIGDVRALFRQILSDAVPANTKSKGKAKLSKSKFKLNLITLVKCFFLHLSICNIFADSATSCLKFTSSILDECHKAFVSCFHVFYPTAYLKWILLCELLSDIDKVSILKRVIFHYAFVSSKNFFRLKVCLPKIVSSRLFWQPSATRPFVCDAPFRF